MPQPTSAPAVPKPQPTPMTPGIPNIPPATSQPVQRPVFSVPPSTLPAPMPSPANQTAGSGPAAGSAAGSVPVSQATYAKPPSQPAPNAANLPQTGNLVQNGTLPNLATPSLAPKSTMVPAPAPVSIPTPTLTSPSTSAPAPALTPLGTPVVSAGMASKPMVPLGSTATSKPGAPISAAGGLSGAPATTQAVAGATKPGAPTPAKAEIKKPPFWLFAIIGVILMAVVGYFAFSAMSGKPSSDTNAGSGTDSTGSDGAASSGKATSAAPVKQTTLIYWGLWEPDEIMKEVIGEFETANPQYKIDYRKQSPTNYRERLQTAIASGNGPDFFRMHATWVPMLIDDLAPLPTNVMTPADFQKTFYPIAVEQLTVGNKIVGIPLMYDGLALFYNKEMLKSANAEPPQTWAELKTLADSLTVPSDKGARSGGKLQRAGLAIGTSYTVESFSDILGLLVKQNGGDLAAPNSTEVRDALLFYTNFVKEDMVWSGNMPSSTLAFTRGEAAMTFAPSWRALEIKASNPTLDFGVAPMPKLGEQRMGWASYWAEGVNTKSKNQAGAWAFIKYLSEKQNQEKFFSAASKSRPFGEPYSRQDMASNLAADPVLGSILADAPTATGWYISSYTHDKGLNDQMIKYYADAIDATLDGKNMEDVLTTLDAGVTKVLRQYNVTKK